MCKEALSLASFEPLEVVTPASSIEFADTLEVIVSRMDALKAQHAQVALVSIALRFEQDGRIYAGRAAPADQSAQHYLENLRSLVRKTDSVFLLRHTFYFLLPGADLNGGAIVQERLWEALLWRVHNTLDGDFLRPRSMTIGHGACETHSNNFTRCIDAASEAQLSFELLPEKAARKVVTTTKDTELSLLARRLGVPYVPLLPRKLPARIQRLVSPTLAQELHCFPIGRDRDILTVAMSNPQDRSALERLRVETGMNIFPVLANSRELQTALEQFV
jgi:Type II secretion system (T2SS), protein E, N-terminal domain